MRVVVNARFYSQAVTGVQRYARNLVAAGLGINSEEAWAALPGIGLVPAGEAATTPIPDRCRKGHVWEQVMLPLKLHRDDMLVGLCNNGPLAVGRQVVAIHDASPAVVPETFSFLHHRLFALSVAVARRATRVVTVSERAKLDLVTHYEMKPDAIDVVPNGVAPEFSPGEVAVDQPYCLFIGAHDPRKNLAFLERLWPEVERRTGLALIATGRQASPAHAASSATRARLLTDVTDDHLVTLYRGAAMVLQPSRYEGFGLPILEGAACGTPFLSNDVGVAMELAVNPDEQVVPLTEEAWIEAIVAMAELDEESRAALNTSTIEIASRFTWDRSAALLGDSIRRAAEELG